MYVDEDVSLIFNSHNHVVNLQPWNNESQANVYILVSAFSPFVLLLQHIGPAIAFSGYTKQINTGFINCRYSSSNLIVKVRNCFCQIVYWKVIVSINIFSFVGTVCSNS